MERFRWIEHKEKRILLNDYSNQTLEEILKLQSQNQSRILGLGRDDILLLVDVSNDKATPEVVLGFKKVAKTIKPHIKKSAVVGVTRLQKILLNAINKFSSLGIEPKSSRKEAMDWLVE